MRKLIKAEVLDGFDVETDEQGDGARRVVQGTKLKFTNDFVWVNNDEDEISPNLELIVADRVRILQKWGTDGMPIETRFLEPEEPWPDVAALNNAAPRSEWRDGFNGPQGPWQKSWVIYLFDPQSGDKYTYLTGDTTGGNMAVGELSDKIKIMRRLRGAHVLPVVTLADTHMNTKYGGRQRPHFKIMRWVCLDGEGGALPSPEAPLLPAQEKPGMTVVEEPSSKEVLDDDVPF